MGFSPENGFQISTTHVSCVLGNTEIFFTSPSAVATYITCTDRCNFVGNTWTAICIRISRRPRYKGWSVVGWTALSISWYRFESSSWWEWLGEKADWHSKWCLCGEARRSHVEPGFSWCLNGPEKAADMDDMLNAQTADPGMLLLNKQNLSK